jgi:hypothetical protein
MIITSGLFQGMVLQRGRDGRCNAAMAGTCETDGVLRARVTVKKRTVRGFASAAIGTARNGSFTGTLRGLPCGGPYDILLTIENRRGVQSERIAVTGILVGDVWILAGQSNMEGLGNLRGAAKPHRMVRAFYMDDHWGVARDPLHELHKAMDPVHSEINGGVVAAKASHLGTGPGVAFAREIYRATGVPQGLIACAHGGTSMAQWDPELKHLEGRSLYGAMLRRVAKNGGAVAGMFWYQGCNDIDEVSAGLYTERMKKLVAAVRRDCRNRTLPWIMVQLARVCMSDSSGRWWNEIRDRQRLLPFHIRGLAVVPAIDLRLEDGIHINGAGQNRLGRRAAHAALGLHYRFKKHLPPISLKSVTVKKDPQTEAAVIHVDFDNVRGGLVSPGRPAGFELSESEDTVTNHYIFDTRCDGSRIELRTAADPFSLQQAALYYGHGAHPFCNIGDSAGRSLPAFGPVSLKTRAISPFVRDMHVSGFLPFDGMSVGRLAYPAEAAGLDMRPRRSAQDFCEFHGEFSRLAPSSVLVYYRVRFRCGEDMKLTVWLGYDGPAKMWVDGAEVYSDPAGTNPARADDAGVAVDAAAGEHEILVALSSNRGLAWGIMLCFERTDVRKGISAGELRNVRLPEIIG